MDKSYSPQKIRSIQYTTDRDNILFFSSSGHCSLDCDYCIVNPIAKREATLDASDIEFVLDALPGRSLLVFSGKGDFFAGYRRADALLSRVLERDVEVVLDINGIALNELPDLPPEKLAKIRLVWLTFHYTQLVRHRALDLWTENARLLIERFPETRLMIDTILTPRERDIWGESLASFASRIGRPHGRGIVLKKDINGFFDDSAEQKVAELKRDFGELIEDVFCEDIASRFAGCETVSCPAGRRYFRIWNDGLIQGCPNGIAELADLGNAKQRRINVRRENFRCRTPKYCDCNDIALLGKMEFK